MIRCLTLTSVFWLISVQSGLSATPLRYQCDSYMQRGGEHTRKLMTLYLDHNTVIDGRLSWHDGSPSPTTAKSVAAYVRRTGPLIEWGSVQTRTGEIINLFSLDLTTGTYIFRSTDEIFAKGRCRLLSDAI